MYEALRPATDQNGHPITMSEYDALMRVLTKARIIVSQAAFYAGMYADNMQGHSPAARSSERDAMEWLDELETSLNGRIADHTLWNVKKCPQCLLERETRALCGQRGCMTDIVQT